MTASPVCRPLSSYEAMLNPNGDTTVYLQYAHARMSSILRKSIRAVQQRTRIVLVDKAEVDLAMKVLSLTYVLSLVRRDPQLLHVSCCRSASGCGACACSSPHSSTSAACSATRTRTRTSSWSTPRPRPCATRWGCWACRWWRSFELQA